MIHQICLVEAFLKLSPLSIKELVKYINDDKGEFIDKARTGPNLVELFNTIGSRDEYWSMSKDGTFGVRADYTKRKLIEFNENYRLKEIFEALVDNRTTNKSDSLAKKLNEILKHDGYKLEKNKDEVYKITGYELADPIQVQAHFENIEQQILNEIKLAKFSIWVCVAWITNKSIGNELYRKHKSGLNVRVIVNDDDLTQSRGCDFQKVGIEYHKFSPKNDNYKNLMHHKFCIIDLKKVITGSFNWTEKANFNFENVEIIASREKAEDFATRFVKIIEDIKQ